MWNVWCVKQEKGLNFLKSRTNQNQEWPSSLCTEKQKSFQNKRAWVSAFTGVKTLSSSTQTSGFQAAHIEFTIAIMYWLCGPLCIDYKEHLFQLLSKRNNFLFWRPLNISSEETNYSQQTMAVGFPTGWKVRKSVRHFSYEQFL